MKSLAINCGPLSVMIRGEVPGYLSRARCKTISTSSSVIAVRNSQCNRKLRTAIQDRAQIEEGAGNVQIRDIHMPVLMGPEGLLETVTLARSLGIPALQEPGGFEYPIGAGGRDGHHVTIQHHESQPAVTLQRELMMESNNGHLFPRLQPMIAWHQSVVLIGFAVTITPRVKLAPAQTHPAN